ncbi:ATP-binding protein [Amycolatopsis suaedae]|uniref:ATP-binding protein n=1 Tax=Amycolatopsis suaedae TaxID=2510978 RepID=A0A4Q7J2P9_9PSEU|nr:ATP-binding protein [Amycolatopsis suaedae]RZQ60234.1 ATP-binding protein [Amycolatopsis suaedae]
MGDVGTATSIRRPVQLRLPAEPERLSLLRLLTEQIATEADFDLDSVADLKIAVDEAVSSLIVAAVAGGDVTCQFTLTAEELRIHVTAPVSMERAPREAGFGWHVMQTVADHVSLRTEPGADGSCVASVSLVKRRQVAAG